MALVKLDGSAALHSDKRLINELVINADNVPEEYLMAIGSFILLFL